MELQAAILLVVSFALLLMFSVPVSYSIVASAFITITAFLTPQFGMFVSAQKVIAGIDSLSLIAVPFFILAGLLMSNGGIAHRLVDLAMLVLRRVPGALALTQRRWQRNVRFYFWFWYRSCYRNRRRYAPHGKRGRL